jgi:ABC-2 type transport system permease protein
MEKIRKSLLPVFTFAKIDIRRLFRDKVAIFFTIAFPLIFLMIFGTLNSGDNTVSFKVAVINQSKSEYSQKFIDETLKKNDVYKVNDEITDLESAQQKMSRSELDAAIVLPEDFGTLSEAGYPTGQAQVIYDQNNEQAARTLAAILESTFEKINSELVPTSTPFTVASESTNSAGLSRFDYTFAGLLGFSVLSLGIFGPTNVFPRLKSRGVLRRYRTTTLRVWQYFLANVLSTATVGLISLTIMFLVAKFYFDLNMQGDYASLMAMVTLGTVVLFGIGLAIGGWAKNENQAAPLAQIVALPMLFLSGTFFPRYVMPEWLQNVTDYLPLTPVIDGVRLIITEGRTIFELGPQIAILAVWGLIIYLIAFKVFRWE